MINISALELTLAHISYHLSNAFLKLNHEYLYCNRSYNMKLLIEKDTLNKYKRLNNDIENWPKLYHVQNQTVKNFACLVLYAM